MTRRWVKTAIIGSLTVLGLAVVNMVVGPFTYWPDVIPKLAPWLDRPSIVPPDAAASYHFLTTGGTSWTWRRTLPQGCADWRASSNYAVLELSADCAATDVSFTTFEDQLSFPKLPQPANDGGRPCPASLSGSDLAVLRKLAADALPTAQTRNERRVLKRVAERLSKVDGDALTTDAGGGCNDLKVSDYSHPYRTDFRLE